MKNNISPPAPSIGWAKAISLRAYAVSRPARSLAHFLGAGATQLKVPLRRQLPAIRTLAQELVISPKLGREGVIELRHGAGAFVAFREDGRRDF